MSHLRLRRHVPAPSATEKPPLPVFEDEKVSTPSDLSWVARRHALVDLALANDDLEALVKISAMPGGFGSENMRRRVWSVLSAYYWASADIEQGQHCSMRTSSSQKTARQKKTIPPRSLRSVKKAWTAKMATGMTASRLQLVHLRIQTKRRSSWIRGELSWHIPKVCFAAYSVRAPTYARTGLPPEGKLEMQADLQDLIVGVLRKYPTLSYFQVRSHLSNIHD